LLGIQTIGLLGRDGGELVKKCDLSVVIGHQQTARIQEMHILIGHIICHSVETHLGLV
jgi:D-sedoheptulose 7-phosphate isomerase